MPPILSALIISLLSANLGGADRPADATRGDGRSDPTHLVGPRRPGDFNVASFNIRYGTADDGPDHWSSRRPRCMAALRELDADVLGLQEVLRFQLDEITAEFPEFRALGVGRDDGVDAGEFSPILVRRDRFRVIEHGTFWLSDTPETPGSATWGNTLPRICTWALLEEMPERPETLKTPETREVPPSGKRPRSPETADAAETPDARENPEAPEATKTPAAAESPPPRRVRVFNTHFDHQSQPSRERSAAALRKRIAAVPPSESIILLGDLNAGPENPAFRLLLGTTDAPRTLIDAWRRANLDAPEAGTFHAFTGTATRGRIDVIMVDPSIALHAVAIDSRPRDGRFPSDHFPVVARVSLSPATGAPSSPPFSRFGRRWPEGPDEGGVPMRPSRV